MTVFRTQHKGLKTRRTSVFTHTLLMGSVREMTQAHYIRYIYAYTYILKKGVIWRWAHNTLAKHQNLNNFLINMKCLCDCVCVLCTLRTLNILYRGGFEIFFSFRLRFVCVQGTATHTIYIYHPLRGTRINMRDMSVELSFISTVYNIYLFIHTHILYIIHIVHK